MVAIPPKINDPRTLIIDYTNYRGERNLRKIIPRRIEFIVDSRHGTDAHWVLEAYDLGKQEFRSFLMSKIHLITEISR